MSKQKGKIIIIVAPSGTGKSTLIKKIKEEFRDLHWSVSFTTRPIRDGEVDGRHYFFISETEFLNKKKQGAFVEWALVHGNYYGTSKGFVLSKIDHGYSILFDLDVQGTDAMKKEFPEDAIGVFIAPPSIEELETRLNARATDTPETIKLRISNAKKELQRKDDYDYCVINDDLEQAYIDLKNIFYTILKG